MDHLQYLNAVNWQVRNSRLSAERDRRNAIVKGQRAIRFGADPATVASTIPHPSPIAAALTPGVLNAATRAFSTAAGPTTSVQEGIQAVSSATSGASIDAIRSTLSPRSVAGFDAGVALVHGAALSNGRVPRGMTAAQRAGWLMAFGVDGAGADVASGVMAGAAQAPGVVQGAASAVQSMASGMTAAAAVGGDDTNTALLLYGGVPVGVLGALSLAGVIRLTLGSFLGLSALTSLAAIGVGVLAGNKYATLLSDTAQNKLKLLTATV